MVKAQHQKLLIIISPATCAHSTLHHLHIQISLKIFLFESTVPVKFSREYSHCTGQYTSSALHSLRGGREQH
jgi:hypothetical protein